MKKLVIGTGPVGLELGKQLLQDGKEVIYVTKSGKINPNINAGCIQLDLLANDFSQLDSLENIDTVYMCAAPLYWKWETELVPMVQSALLIAKKLGATFIFADNMYAYGKPSGSLSEESGLNASSIKGIARKKAAKVISEAEQSMGVKTAIVRSSDFYGSDVNISMLGSYVFKSILEGKTVNCLGNIDKLHSFTFIEDFARALINVSSNDDCYGQVWHAPNSEAVSMKSITSMIGKKCKKDVRYKVAPKVIFYIMGLFNKPIKELREVYYLYDSDFIVNSDKYQNYFNEQPTSITKGLDLTIEARPVES